MGTHSSEAAAGEWAWPRREELRRGVEFVFEFVFTLVLEGDSCGCDGDGDRETECCGDCVAAVAADSCSNGYIPKPTSSTSMPRPRPKPRPRLLLRLKLKSCNSSARSSIKGINDILYQIHCDFHLNGKRCGKWSGKWSGGVWDVARLIISH